MALQGKVAIVTGASGGIGRAYALALAGAGATVVALARTVGDPGRVEPGTLAETVAAAAGLPGRILSHACDLGEEGDIVAAVAAAIDACGRIDVLVNNAATMRSFDPLAIGAAEWDATMRLNLRAPYLMIREVAPHLQRRGAGSIVNITARAAAFTAKADAASDGTLAYAVGKAGLNRLSFFMAEELRPWNIAVNALSPGVVRTGGALAKHPDLGARGIGKLPVPELLGPALIFLAQQTAATMTGQILHADDFGTSWP